MDSANKQISARRDRTVYAFRGQNRWLGPEVEWDSIEIPSKLMEEWVRDPAILQSFARHYQTGEPIPAGTVRALLRANEFGKGFYIRHNMALTAAALRYHDRQADGLDTTRVLMDA